MKIKTNIYGIFYKDSGEWRGPYQTLIRPNKKEIKSIKKSASTRLKKKIKILKEFWE